MKKTEYEDPMKPFTKFGRMLYAALQEEDRAIEELMKMISRDKQKPTKLVDILNQMGLDKTFMERAQSFIMHVIAKHDDISSYLLPYKERLKTNGNNEYWIE